MKSTASAPKPKVVVKAVKVSPPRAKAPTGASGPNVAVARVKTCNCNGGGLR